MSHLSASDKTLAQKVTQALMNHGLRPPCHIDVACKNGQVTLSGTIQYEIQRNNALRAARGVTGVKRVNDSLHRIDRPVWR